MGWLWNAQIVGLPIIRRGWRPGAIRKSVAKIMQFYLTPPAEPAPPVEQVDPPTLRVKKKNGEFTIVMNPLRDELSHADPSPIVFKVTQSDEVKRRSNARKILKSRGVEKSCSCTSLESCCCLTSCEKVRLKSEMQRLSMELCLKPELSVGDLKETSESEMDVEFTPPSAAKLKHPGVGVKCKPVKVSVAETQYEAQRVSVDVEAKADNSKSKKCDAKPDRAVRNRAGAADAGGEGDDPNGDDPAVECEM